MIKEASQKTVAAILGKDNTGKESHYLIPPYQREYSWGIGQWENFFTDLYDSEKNYFLGSIICILKESETSDIQHVDVIDGQQRLTTINILLLAIYKHITQLLTFQEGQQFYFHPENDEIQSSYLILKQIFKSKNKLTLSIQNNNDNDFTFLTNFVLHNDNHYPAHFGNRRISKAYSFFFNQIELFLGTETPVDQQLQQLFEFLNKVTSALMVRIDTEDASSAFILFESINNRGMPLTPIDLIKNSIIGHTQATPEKTNEKWQKIIGNIQDYEAQVRYLRHFYHAFSHESRIKIIGTHKLTKSNLIKTYTDLIKKDVDFILQELIQKSFTYKIFVAPETLQLEHIHFRYQDVLIRMKKLGVAPSYSLLLFLFYTHPMQDFTPLLQWLEKWFMIRHLTNTPPTSKLDQIFIDLIEQQQNAYCFETIKLTLMALIPNQQAIHAQLLKSDLYTDNVNLARSLLVHLEQRKRTTETKTDFWALNSKGKPIWSIEHIYPQTPKNQDDWSEDCSECLHQLGNLTLSAYNSNLSNKSFQEKACILDANGNDIGLQSGNIGINDTLINLDDWNTQHIKSRSQELTNMFLDGLFN